MFILHSVFYLKIHQNNFFFIFKNYFNINTSKRFENTKKKYFKVKKKYFFKITFLKYKNKWNSSFK